MQCFIIGDIHGSYDCLIDLWQKIMPLYKKGDRIIFCGDYIDRGSNPYGVVDFLANLDRSIDAIFLTGNHESMLRDYLINKDSQLYIVNGGSITIKSYSENTGSFFIPDSHRKILFSGVYYYEGDDFIVVHAGFNPEYPDPFSTDENEMVWIRDDFFKSSRLWNKTIIFGHTPTQYIGMPLGSVYNDNERNIIGIDTGAVYGGKLTCIVMPGKKIIQSKWLDE